MSVHFFAEKHSYLENDYKDESGQHTDSCFLNAIDLGVLLRNEGKKPHILIIRGETDETGDRNRVALVPKPFNGRVQWGAHIVCEAEGVVYDPMLDTPLPLEEYLEAAFTQKVEIEDHTQTLDRY
jgi:hypothetical protein